MALSSFLIELMQQGRVRLSGREPLAVDDLPDPELLAALDGRERAEAPGEAPALNAAVAGWAARVIYQGCRFLAYRDLDAQAVREGLREPCPGRPEDSSTVWSADLCLRWLPDLMALARGVAPGDPLVEGLREVARAWPLSSVGVGDLGELELDPILAHPCLRDLYVDRVLARGDATRSGEPRIDVALRAALGLHPELAPAALAAALFPAEATP